MSVRVTAQSLLALLARARDPILTILSTLGFDYNTTIEPVSVLFMVYGTYFLFVSFCRLKRTVSSTVERLRVKLPCHRKHYYL